jgi:hypothetical protein
MMMRQFISLWAAAAFAVASMGTHAITLVDANEGDLASGKSSVTYAKETLLKSDTAVTTGADGAKYYDIARDHYVTGRTGIYAIANANDAYVVSYTLEGMVFAETPEAKAHGGGVSADIILSAILGGGAGDNYVVFQAANANIVRDTTDPFVDPIIQMTAMFAVSGEGSGSITRVVQNRALRDLGGNLPWTEEETLSAAVRILPALVEAVMANSDTPVAAAEHDFMQFKPSNLSASVGTVKLSIVGEGDATPFAMQYRDAQSTVQLDAQEAFVDMLADVIGPDGTDPLDNAVTFSGDFSFVKTLAIAADTLAGNECSNATGELRKPSEDDADVLTDETIPKAASDFATTQHVCIVVSGTTEIPRADPYMVTTKYIGITDAAFPPPGGTYPLSGITRDGTTAAIPFLVAQEHRYRQRISIVNRNAEAVEYSFTFTGEEGATITSGAAAEGEVPANMTVVLDTRDIVTIEGGVGRTAASLSVVATPGTIDVAVTLVNRMDGSTTVVHASN